MKKIFFYLIASTFLVITSGCEKEIMHKAGYNSTDKSKALVKINYMSLYAANPGVQLSINNQRVSGLITGRTPFPGGGYNTNGSSFPDYLALAPGSTELSISIPNKGTNTDSILLFKTTITLEAGMNQTVHVTDTAASTKTVTTIDDISLPAEGFAKLKFVNLMPNVPSVDLYYGSTLVAAGISYLSSSNYFTIAVPVTSLAWTIREAGTSATSTALATYTSGNTTLNRRVYTAFAIGYKGSTDAARKPYISFNLN